MTLRQTIQAAPGKTTELITKLSATSNRALKTRESLFAQLSDELTRYVEIEEQHFLPLLRKHSETKGLVSDALKGNKGLRASLEKLSDMPKDTDEFLAELDGLNKSFQQHVRNERKELLPAVLKALSDEEAGALADNIEGAVADAEKAKRDEKNEEAAHAKRQAEDAEHSVAAERAAARDREAAERSAREATDKAKREKAAQAKRQAEETEHAAAAERTAALDREAAERTAHEATEKAKRDSDSSQKVLGGLQAVRTSSTASAGAVAEIHLAWMDWFGSAARINADASRQLMQCKTVKQVAEIQKEFVTSALRNWMEGNAKILQIAQRTSKQALGPLDSRMTKAD
jgi:hypothetical protein